jgi:spore maturation protein A
MELAGALCLWSAVTELLESGGAADALARFLRVPLRALFPRGFCDQDTRASLTENLSANLLGLGNAATPAGIRAAKGLSRFAAEKELHLLVVVNTASIQLLPTTAASVRASLGSAAPFDITGAVWVSSALSLLAGLAAIRLLDGGKA